MTQQSLIAEQTRQSWIDEAFLWTATSLAVIAVAAAAPAPSVWSASMALQAPAPPSPPRPPPRHPAPLPPAPLISFADPVPGYPVISPFGLRQLPWEAHARLHQGVDIAAPSGSPVLAAADGVVVRTGADAGYGRFVELQHADGLTSLYGHLEVIAVRPGARVKAGEAVGRVGSTGSSTGSHLHFEIHDRRQRPLDPERFLGRAFYSEAELPLRAARRLPRGIRVAYVSFIPASKRDDMAERQAEEAAAAARRQAEADRRAMRLAVLGRRAIQPSPPSSLATPPRTAAQPATAAPAPADAASGQAAARVHARIDQTALF